MSRHRPLFGFSESVNAFKFYDGDSVQVQDWDETGPFVGPFHGKSWNVRLKGIDAPEISHNVGGGAAFHHES